ncbi:anti-sigma factor domain-containing protein [Marisediminicola sp. LYQ134]|uniref:anti-sigma factor domain-containing protein n=1 Tax=Marisediminicola sp. LYQ134 TaxID=3391061 RepID=UPI0039839D7C
MTERDDMHLLAGAYALDAVTEEEKQEFEAYLARSEEARTEVAELTDTAVMLGLAAAPVAPPVDLKARLMAQLGSTAQLPPLPQAPTAPTSDLDDTVAPTIAQQRGIDSLAAERSGSERPGSERRQSPAEAKAAARWYRKPATLMLSAAAAVAIFAGGALAGPLFAPADTELAQAEQLAELTGAPDLEQAVAEVAGGGVAKVLSSDDAQLSAVVIDSLPQLDAQLVYQLWYIDAEGTAAPAGTFTAVDAGPTWRVLDGTKASTATVGITVEPRGGSESPTTDPILVVGDV